MANNTINATPVSTEELLSKGSKKASLAPEDDTIFVEKNTSQLGYERTWERSFNFSTQSNGETNNISIENDAYGMRADTARFYLTFEITLAGSTTDNASMANFFPFVAFNTFNMRIGANQVEVVAPMEHYMYRFLNVMNSNYSTQDKINVLPLSCIFPFMDLTLKSHRKLMAAMWGFTWTQAAVSNLTKKVTFVMPLTLVHQMFNHRTILPVGTRLEFAFNVSAECNKNAIVNGDAAAYVGSYKFLPRESSFVAEFPERDPSIMIAQMENRVYISEDLTYETFRYDQVKGASSFSIPLLRPGSKLPVKIDFGFVPGSVKNANKDVFQFKGFGLKDVLVKYNGPFPQDYRYSLIGCGGNDEWKDDANGPALCRFPLFAELFNQTDTFQLDRFGESYNNETTFPPLNRIHPYMAYVAQNVFRTYDDDVLATMKRLFDDRQVYTSILLPSKLMDGSAYPTVSGSLEIEFCFNKPLEEDVILYCNLYTFNRMTLDEDYRCTITSITLENFAGGSFDASSGLPPPVSTQDLEPGEEETLLSKQ